MKENLKRILNEGSKGIERRPRIAGRTEEEKEEREGSPNREPDTIRLNVNLDTLAHNDDEIKTKTKTFTIDIFNTLIIFI